MGGTEVEQRVVGWATNVSAGPANDYKDGTTDVAQTVEFNLTSLTNADLFTGTGQPAIAKTAGGTWDLTYTPAHNAYGTSVVTVRLEDDGGLANGGVDTLTHSLTIEIRPVNDKPSFAVNTSL